MDRDCVTIDFFPYQRLLACSPHVLLHSHSTTNKDNQRRPKGANSHIPCHYTRRLRGCRTPTQHGTCSHHIAGQIREQVTVVPINSDITLTQCCPVHYPLLLLLSTLLGRHSCGCPAA